MRFIFSAAIIALLFDSVGSAQSLADFARQERARRQASTVDGAIYTNEEVQGPYVPEIATSQPADPELISTLEELEDRLQQFEADAAPPTAGLADAGTGMSGPRVEMLEAFEAGSILEIERLDFELGDLSVTGAERAELEAEMLNAQGILSAVREELVEARFQADQPPAVESQVELTPRGVGAAFAGGEVAWEAWEAAVAQQRGRVQGLGDSEVRQLLEITRLRGLVTAPTGSQQQRNQAQLEVGIAEGQLEGIRTALDVARIELERLEANTPGSNPDKVRGRSLMGRVVAKRGRVSWPE